MYGWVANLSEKMLKLKAATVYLELWRIGEAKEAVGEARNQIKEDLRHAAYRGMLALLEGC